MGVDTCLLRILLYFALFGLSFFNRAFAAFASAIPGRELPAGPRWIKELLPEVAAFYEVNFLYSSDFLPKLERQPPSFEQHSLEETLRFIFAGTDVEYVINGKNVLLREKRPGPGNTGNLPATPASRTSALSEAAFAPRPAVVGVPGPLAYQLQSLHRVGFEGYEIKGVPQLAHPLAEVELATPMPVKLGPVYVLPRRQYDFLERLGEPVEKMKPGMRPVLTSYSNTEHREDQLTLYKFRLMNLSFVPGLGTNGLNPGTYYNGVSVNLTVDYSAGNSIIGVSGISNFSKYSAYGLQLAGLVNVVGGDVRQHRYYTRAELLEMRSPFQGVQLAGVGNIVTGDVKGFEAASLFNLVGGASKGWQLAGLANLTAEKASGLQTALLFNYTGQSVSGIQLAAFNYAHHDLFGLQVGLVNRNRNMSSPGYATMSGNSLQLGLLNKTGIMGGFQFGLANLAGGVNGIQVGLINYSGETKGTQIGLVNVFSDHHGHAIGLLNVGAEYYLRFWANETFTSVIGLSTGTDKVINTIFYGRNLLLPSGPAAWPTQSFGYGLSCGDLFKPRDLFSQEFIDYRFNLSWVNFSGVEKQPFNLLFNPHMVYGRKIADGWYITLGGGLNTWWTPRSDSFRLSRLELGPFAEAQKQWKMWPGLAVGIEMM